MKKVISTVMLVSVLVSGCGTMTANTQIDKLEAPVTLTGTANLGDQDVKDISQAVGTQTAKDISQAVGGEIVGVDKTASALKVKNEDGTLVSVGASDKELELVQKALDSGKKLKIFKDVKDSKIKIGDLSSTDIVIVENISGSEIGS